MAVVDYESLTVLQLRDELEGRGLDTGGNKPALVDRLEADDDLKAETDQTSGLAPESGPEPKGLREQREIEVGGHRVMVDVDPSSPDEVVMCSVCGADGGCVHVDPGHGQTWTVVEPAPERQAAEDTTFWPDETVGPRSAEKG